MPLTLANTPAAAIAKLAAASGRPKSEIAELVNETRARAAATASTLSNKKRREYAKHATAERVLAQLAELYPHLFGGRPQPLAIGIGDALIARHPEIPAADIKTFLGKWTRSRRYAWALKFNRERFDLDGNPAGDAGVEFQFMTIEGIMAAQRKRKK
ncbi:MAG: hypothetical protein ING19_07335 [Azospirillum sp.]|nr:hypothetical protein [Azospirillum sp.]MCA3265869.1 hypothetical protein [Azospirillum sp.]